MMQSRAGRSENYTRHSGSVWVDLLMCYPAGPIPHSLIMEVLESWSYQNFYCEVNIHILCEQQCFYIFNSVFCVFSNSYICRIFIWQFLSCSLFRWLLFFGCRKWDNPRRTLCRLCVGFTILCCCLPQWHSLYLFYSKLSKCTCACYCLLCALWILFDMFLSGVTQWWFMLWKWTASSSFG